MLIFQWIVFIGLIAVSGFFTTLLALGLGVSLTERLVLVFGSLMIEGLKTYAIIAANTLSLEHSWRKAIGLYLVYFFVAFYSLSACLGYALSAVDRMAATNTLVVHNESITTEQKTITDFDEQIASLRSIVVTHQNTLKQPADDKNINQRSQARKGIVDLQNRIDGYIQKRAETLSRIEALREKDRGNRVETKRSMYEIIGESINISTTKVAFLILLVFSVAIELGIFITSPHGPVHRIVHNKPEKKGKKETLALIIDTPSTNEEPLIQPDDSTIIGKFKHHLGGKHSRHKKV